MPKGEQLQPSQVPADNGVIPDDQSGSLGAPRIHTNADGHRISTDRFGQSVDNDNPSPTGRDAVIGKDQGIIWGG